MYMERKPKRQPPSSGLTKAYQTVMKQRRMNTSIFHWSFAYSEQMKEAEAGNGVTLYIL